MTAKASMFTFCVGAVLTFNLASGNRVKIEVNLADQAKDTVPCYITERDSHVRYGLTMVTHTSQFKCNHFFAFDPKTGPWHTEVLQNTFTADQQPDSNICSCQLNREGGAVDSHKFVVGSFSNLKHCDAPTCFTAYAHQMYAAAHYREQPGHRVLATSFDHWHVTKEASGVTGTVVPTVTEVVEEINGELSPGKQQQMLQDIVKEAGATVDADVKEIADATVPSKDVGSPTSVMEDLEPPAPAARVVIQETIIDEDAVAEAKASMDNAGCGGKECYEGTCFHNKCICNFLYTGPACDVGPENRDVADKVISVPFSEFEGLDISADEATTFAAVLPMEHKQGTCSHLQSPSTDVQCGPITTAATCKAAGVFLKEEKAKTERSTSFASFSDYSDSSSAKLRDSMPGFCAAKLINDKGAMTWHVKFNGVDRPEHRAKATGRNDMIHYRLICGCWPVPVAAPAAQVSVEAHDVLEEEDPTVHIESSPAVLPSAEAQMPTGEQVGVFDLWTKPGTEEPSSMWIQDGMRRDDWDGCPEGYKKIDDVDVCKETAQANVEKFGLDMVDDNWGRGFVTGRGQDFWPHGCVVNKNSNRAYFSNAKRPAGQTLKFKFAKEFKVICQLAA